MLQVVARRSRWILPVVVLGVALGGCRSAFRYPVQPQHTARLPDAALDAGMNPFVLTNGLSTRLEIEVDWVEGGRPHDDALLGLERTLMRYLPDGKTLVIQLDDEIPRAVWDTGDGGFLERQAILSPFLDFDPAATDAERVWVVVVPGDERFLGWTTELVVERGGAGDAEPHRVDAVFLFRDSIERESALWITPRKIEQAILVHELGHVLGLVSGVDHIEKDNPRHCTEPGCVMAHHRARSQLYNAAAALIGKIPDDYCGKCRRDIARVRGLWAERAATDPAFVDRLAKRREARDLRAQACWYADNGHWPEAADRWRRARAIEREAGAATDDDSSTTVQLERLCAPSPSWEFPDGTGTVAPK